MTTREQSATVRSFGVLRTVDLLAPDVISHRRAKAGGQYSGERRPERGKTVNAGLREIIATAARRREIERLLDPEPSDIEDPEIMAQAWR